MKYCFEEKKICIQKKSKKVSQEKNPKKTQICFQKKQQIKQKKTSSPTLWQFTSEGENWRTMLEEMRQSVQSCCQMTIQFGISANSLSVVWSGSHLAISAPIHWQLTDIIDSWNFVNKSVFPYNGLDIAKCNLPLLTDLNVKRKYSQERHSLTETWCPEHWNYQIREEKEGPSAAVLPRFCALEKKVNFSIISLICRK